MDDDDVDDDVDDDWRRRRGERGGLVDVGLEASETFPGLRLRMWCLDGTHEELRRLRHRTSRMEEPPSGDEDDDDNDGKTYLVDVLLFSFDGVVGVVFADEDREGGVEGLSEGLGLVDDDEGRLRPKSGLLKVPCKGEVDEEGTMGMNENELELEAEMEVVAPLLRAIG